MGYEVDFEYSVPEWGTIDGIDDNIASNKEEAEEFALKEIERLFPEAFDIEITEVRDLNEIKNSA